MSDTLQSDVCTARSHEHIALRLHRSSSLVRLMEESSVNQILGVVEEIIYEEYHYVVPQNASVSKHQAQNSFEAVHFSAEQVTNRLSSYLG